MTGALTELADRFAVRPTFGAEALRTFRVDVAVARCTVNVMSSFGGPSGTVPSSFGVSTLLTASSLAVRTVMMSSELSVLSSEDPDSSNVKGSRTKTGKTIKRVVHILHYRYCGIPCGLWERGIYRHRDRLKVVL